MAGLDPAIHVLRTAAAEDGDPRDKPGDDAQCYVRTLFLTSASTLAISLRIPARRGARSRGVAVTGRGTVLRQVSHACLWEAARCKTRCPPQRTVREEPSGSSHRHTRAGRLLAPSLDLTPSQRHTRREDARACSLTAEIFEPQRRLRTGPQGISPSATLPRVIPGCEERGRGFPAASDDPEGFRPRRVRKVSSRSCRWWRPFPGSGRCRRGH